MLAVDGFQLPPRGALCEERVHEEAAENVQGFVEVPRVHVEKIVRVLHKEKARKHHIACCSNGHRNQNTFANATPLTSLGNALF